MTTSVSVMVVSRVLIGPSFRDGPPELGSTRVQPYHCPSRQQPTWMDQTRNLEIPGSTLARRPGMTFQSLSKTLMLAQRQVKISVPRPALLAASPYAPLPVPERAPCRNPAAG